MFSYYGSKSKIVDYYPKPRFDTIIEPFAGSARYSLKYWEHDVILVDKYEVIVKIWHWLQQASKEDILRLPVLKRGEKIAREMFDCEESFHLMGYLIQRGNATPALTLCSFAEKGVKEELIRISKDLHKIKHWTIVHGDYKDLENRPVTWFIDPPYQFGGHSYKESNRKINFQELAVWCQDRQGQAIVCENIKADWLPFKPMLKTKGKNNKFSTEAIWSNLRTNYDDQKDIPNLFEAVK